MMRLILFATTLFVFSCASESSHEQVSDDSSTVQEGPNSPFGSQKIYWHYEDTFSDEEQEKLQSWITEVSVAVIETLGQYPFDLHVVFHASDNNVPVTFGHTKRGETQAVHFYVNASFPLKDFAENWTAQHEIAHLSIPFIGRNNSWFAEGYATYLSRQIMITQGYYTEASFDSLYLTRIGESMVYFGSCEKTHLEISDSLKSVHQYGHFYWGSSSFFFTADRLLQEKHGMRFLDVVNKYQESNRLNDHSLVDIIASYDEIISDDLFRKLMWSYRNNPSCEVMKGY